MRDIVEESGIDIWLGGKEKKKFIFRIVFCFLILVGLIVFLLINAVNLTERVVSRDKKIEVLEKENKKYLADKNRAVLDKQICQYDLGLAWEAWSRRSNLLFENLDTDFRYFSDDFEADESQAVLDFVTGREDCDPSMDGVKVFGYLDD